MSLKDKLSFLGQLILRPTLVCKVTSQYVYLKKTLNHEKFIPLVHSVRATRPQCIQVEVLDLVLRYGLILGRRGPERKTDCKLTSLLVFSFAPAEAQLHLGVQIEKRELKAHSWVSLGGRVFSEDIAVDEYEIIKSFHRSSGLKP